MARLDWINSLHDRRRLTPALNVKLLFLTSLNAVILQMRLYAMYSLNKKVLAFMIASFIFSSASSGAVMGTVLSRVTGSHLTSSYLLNF